IPAPGSDSMRSDSMIVGINRRQKNSISRLGLGGAALQRCDNWLAPIVGFSRCGQAPAQEMPLAPSVTARWGVAIALTVGLAATGCGYRRVGNAPELPQNIHTLAIPGFVSHSRTFRIEQLLTDAVVREFNARTQYHVIHEASGDADAVLRLRCCRRPPVRWFMTLQPGARSALWSR